MTQQLLSIYLSIYLPIYLSIYLSIHPSIYLSIYRIYLSIVSIVSISRISKFITSNRQTQAPKTSDSARFGAIAPDVLWLMVEPTHLKNMLVKMGSSSPNRGENRKYLKPPRLVWKTFLTFTFGACKFCLFFRSKKC